MAPGATIETAVSETDIFASTTGHSNILHLVHMEMLIVGSTGHFGNEIDFVDSEGFDGMKSTTSCLRLSRLGPLSLFIQHATSTSTVLGRVNQAMSNAFAEHFDNEIDLAGSEGLQGLQVYNNIFQKIISSLVTVQMSRFMVCATGHHPILMWRPVTNLVLMLFDLFRYWQETTAYENEVYLLPTTGSKFKVTSCTFSTRYGASPSLFRDGQFLEVSRLRALSRVGTAVVAVGRFCRFQGLWPSRGW